MRVEVGQVARSSPWVCTNRVRLREHVRLNQLPVVQHALLVAARAEGARLAGIRKQGVVAAGVAVDAGKTIVRVDGFDSMKRPITCASSARRAPPAACNSSAWCLAHCHKGLARGLRGRYCPLRAGASAAPAVPCPFAQRVPIQGQTRQRHSERAQRLRRLSRRDSVNAQARRVLILDCCHFAVKCGSGSGVRGRLLPLAA